FHSLSWAMYHIADADKMVQKRPGSCCTGSLDQRSLRGISARDMKGKRPFRLVLLVVRVYHHIDSKSRTSCQRMFKQDKGSSISMFSTARKFIQNRILRQ